MIDIKKISDIDWVKNGDTLSGVYSIYDFSDGELDPYEYDYGINRPYRSLIDNDKKILKGIKDVALNFGGYDFSNDLVRGTCQSYQFVPNTSVVATNEAFQLFTWKLVRPGGYFGVNLSAFKAKVTKFDNPRDCVSPGLDSGGLSINLSGVGSKSAVVQVKIGVRPFGCPTDADIKNCLKVYYSGKEIASMPVTFKAPTLIFYNPGHDIAGDNIWVPITSGCTVRQTATFLVDLTKGDKNLDFKYSFSGSYASYAALSFIDVDVFPVINGF